MDIWTVASSERKFLELLEPSKPASVAHEPQMTLSESQIA